MRDNARHLLSYCSPSLFHRCTLLVVECGDPGTPLNGVKLGSRMDYLLTVVYSCTPGYAVIGDRTRTCQATGLWTGTLPVCKLVDCGDPGTLANGFRIGSNQNFGNEVSYRCDFGFQLSGSQTRSCQSNGRWSGTLPVCMSKCCSHSTYCNIPSLSCEMYLWK